MVEKVVVACAALKDELDRILKELGYGGSVAYLDSSFHLRPNVLKAKLTQFLDLEKGPGKEVFVVYGQCFQGIEDLCRRSGVGWTKAENCYHMFLGNDYFRLMEEEPGTYFLDRYLSENFQSLCIQGLGLDRYPEFKQSVFGHYKRAVYIDMKKEGIIPMAEKAANYMDIPVQAITGDPDGLKKVLQLFCSS